MRLMTEEIGDVPDVDAATLDEVLGYDAFGKFGILTKSDEEFIQTDCDWRPDKAIGAFLAATGSDLWVLKYRKKGRQFSVEGSRDVRASATSAPVVLGWRVRVAHSVRMRRVGRVSVEASRDFRSGSDSAVAATLAAPPVYPRKLTTRCNA
jgi:hypothetical protein